MKYQVKRLGIEINLICKREYLLYIVEVLAAGLAVLSYFYFPVYTIVLVLIALPIYIYQLVLLVYKKQMWIWISIGAIHLIFIFMFAFLYGYTAAPNQFILIYILFGLLTIIDVLSNYCFKQNTNNIK